MNSMNIPPSGIIVIVFTVVITDYLFQSDNIMTAAKSLVGGTLVLNFLGYLFFNVLFYPWYYRWVGAERGGLSVAQVREELSSSTTPLQPQQTPSSRMAVNFAVEICGHVAILLYTGTHFDVTSSYRQAIITAMVLDVAVILPRIHHYFWEVRPWKLIVTVELYQLLRRIVAAVILCFLSQITHEELPGSIVIVDFIHSRYWFSKSFQQTIFVIGIMAVARFMLAYLWYGPFFSRYWLRAIRQFKRDDKFPSNVNIHMPVLIMAGVLCGMFQNILLIEIQHKLDGATQNIELAIRFGFYLWFFYLLPTASTDLWEGKPYKLPLIEYSLHLVEICGLFAVNALYQNW